MGASALILKNLCCQQINCGSFIKSEVGEVIIEARTQTFTKMTENQDELPQPQLQQKKVRSQIIENGNSVLSENKKIYKSQIYEKNQNRCLSEQNPQLRKTYIKYRKQYDDDKAKINLNSSQSGPLTQEKQKNSVFFIKQSLQKSQQSIKERNDSQVFQGSKQIEQFNSIFVGNNQLLLQSVVVQKQESKAKKNAKNKTAFLNRIVI